MAGGGRRCKTSRVRVLRKLRTIEGEPKVCVKDASTHKLRRLICRVISGTMSRTLTNCYGGVRIAVRGSGSVAIRSSKHKVPIKVGRGTNISTLRIIFAILRTNKGFNNKKCGMSKKLRKMNTSIIGTLST